MKKLVILCILSLVSVSIFAQIRRAHSVSRRGLYGQYYNAVAFRAIQNISPTTMWKVILLTLSINI